MFFHFDQNNSGGSFVLDERRGITNHVIIEAPDAKTANDIAEDKGLYFDGYGDCECCGNRWSPQWRDDRGTEVPMIYGKEIVPYVADDDTCKWMPEGKEVVVHYADGRVEWA